MNYFIFFDGSVEAMLTFVHAFTQLINQDTEIQVKESEGQFEIVNFHLASDDFAIKLGKLLNAQKDVTITVDSVRSVDFEGDEY